MQTLTLDNGLRIVVARRPGQVVYCGLAVEAGTRHQLDTESGMAHFVEHMSFKGTQRRRAWHIINRMEAVGGELNAYTGKEHTVYYCSTLRHHLHRALDLLFDLVLHSTYPQHEMDKEVEVVCDEIESYNDSPSELIFDDFEALLFPNQPLGRNILGDADRLRQYRSADLQRFVGRLYHPSRMVLFVLGDVDMRSLRFVGRLADVPIPDTPSLPSVPSAPHLPSDLAAPSLVEQVGEGAFRIHRSTHQAHVVVGCRAYAQGDPRYMALYLLNNLLGGPGMNSRLNLALRERRGLVYTVESSLTAYTDTGLWTAYFGCDHHDVDRCLRLLFAELRRLADAPLPDKALATAKQQLKGQAALSWENGENVAVAMGCRLLHQGRTLSLDEFCQSVDALSAAQLHDVAQELFSPDRLLTLRYT